MHNINPTPRSLVNKTFRFQTPARLFRPLLFSTLAIVLVATLALTACAATGPSAEEMTQTAVAAYTPTPAATPTPAGITPDQDLAALIDAAADGDVITLAPGNFNLSHSLVIDKNLTLVGAGVEQTKVSGDTPTADAMTMILISGTGNLTVQGIAFEYTGSSPAAVFFTSSGGLAMQDCSVTGATMTEKGTQLGNLQMGNNSVALIRNSTFAGSLNRSNPDDPEKVPGGIIVYGTAQLTIENSMITDSYLGIYAYGSSVVTVNQSTIAHGYAGISLLENSSGTLTGNTFNQNSGVQVVILNTAQLTASENRLTNNANSIGFQIAEDSKAHLEKNIITGGINGILFKDNASGEAVSNEITEFSQGGIYIDTTAVTQLTENTLQSTQAQAIGIIYTGASLGAASRNTISNTYVGISLIQQAAPTLDANILDACTIGIFYQENSSGSAVNNTIQNGDYGIMVNSPARPGISNNTIQAFAGAVITDPEDYINQLDVHDNNLQDGPPEVVVSTFTPTP